MTSDLLGLRPADLCRSTGDYFIHPWWPAARAVISTRKGAGRMGMT